MPQNYVIQTQIEYPADTVLSNVQVTVRQNATNESFTKNTDSNGQATFNLGSSAQFPSGWSVGDSFTIFVIYQGFDGKHDHTTVAGEGGHSKTLVLTAAPSAPNIVLFNPQDFLTVLDVPTGEVDDQNGVDVQRIVTVGEGVQAEIENDCDTKFDNNDGSYYSQTDYFDDDADHRMFTPTKKPVVSVTSLKYNGNREGSADDFTTALTQNTDYFLDADTNQIRIARATTKTPEENRMRGWELIYTYGRSPVPKDIKLLAIYDTAIKMGLISVVKAKIFDKEADSDDFMKWFTAYRNRIINRYRDQTFLNA